jgi:hypothetical protein
MRTEYEARNAQRQSGKIFMARDVLHPTASKLPAERRALLVGLTFHDERDERTWFRKTLQANWRHST